MSSLYAGDPTNFPDNVTLPDDADPPKALAFNPAIEGALDRTAYLKANHPLHAVNWLAKQTPLTGSPRFAFYAPKVNLNSTTHAKAQWWIIGTAKDARYSSDHCLSWAGGSAITVGAGTEELATGASDGAGNLVIAIWNQMKVFTRAVSTDSWALVTILTGTTGFTWNSVVYDPVNARWIWAATDAGVVYAAYSADRATWTGAGTAGDISYYGSAISMAVNDSSGRAILAGFGSASALTLRRSDDGGVTWTAGTIGTSTLTAVTSFALTYGADRATWMLVVADSASLKSEVWTSIDDGITWTKVATLTNAVLTRAALNGTTWCAMAIEGSGGSAPRHVVYSLDAGVTWRKAGVALSGTPQGVFAGGGGFLAITTTDTIISLRAGLPDLGTLT